MGNTSVSPIKNNNNKILHNDFNNDKYSIKKSINYSPNLFSNHSNKIIHNFNKIKNLDYDENTNRKSTYLYGYHQKSNKKSLSYKIFKRANSKKKSQNKTINNITKYSFLFLQKQLRIEDSNNNNINKNHNYMKRYKNDDKFYRYGKKTNTIISKDSNNNLKVKKKFYDTEIINNKDKFNRIIDNDLNSRNKKNKSFKNDKSSQFVLLNNSKNLFNAFQDVNADKNNNNHTIIGGNSNIINEIKLTTINEPNLTDNFTNLNNNSNFYDNDNLNISQNSSIKYNKYNYTHTSFIYNKPQIILDQLKDYIDDDNEITEKNNKFKGTYMTNISTNIHNLYSGDIIDNSDYIYIGDILPNKIKEGIGKIIYKNNFMLISLFNNNIINGPIIISDIHNNIFQGYIKDNNFNGYFILNFNFNQSILKNKLNSKNYFENLFTSNKNNDDEIINIIRNYNNLLHFYLDLSDENYNYSYLETYISINNINDIGIIKWKNNSSYVGEIKNGVKDGIGIFKWPDGSKYEGEFIKDRIEGQGVIYYLDGNIYKGQILDGLPHGYGEFIWNNENRYIGNYFNGQKEGFGIYIMISENLREYISYFGFWKKGKQDGFGIIIKNKNIYYVKYKEGRKLKNYKYDFFIREILPFISKKYKKIFQSESKYLRKIVKNIIYY